MRCDAHPILHLVLCDFVKNLNISREKREKPNGTISPMIDVNKVMIHS